jgi:D-sedoheptulose 7-phosphate isomerase
MTNEEIIEKGFKSQIDILEKLSSRKKEILAITDLVFESVSIGRTIFFMGNGGSAAESQHISAISLNVDSSAITAISNDYKFEDIFKRQIQALVSSNDLLVGLTTSGKSENIEKGFKIAKFKGAKTIRFTGEEAPFNEYVDIDFKVPSDITARIQETHLIVWHLICEMIDEQIEN